MSQLSQRLGGNACRSLVRRLLSPSPPSRSMMALLPWQQKQQAHRSLATGRGKGSAATVPAAPPSNAAEEATEIRLPRVYEPAYLDVKPDYPAMALFHVSLTSHEYPVLERFARYAQSLVQHQFGVDQCEQLAWPQRKTTVDLYQPESTKVRDSFQLSTYRRVITVDGLPAAEAGLLINVLGQNLPEGVAMSVEEPTEEDMEFRYVPDLEVQVLKKQVEMGRVSGRVKS